jgi:lipopolysaccharide biosynthesis regulator YciM
MPPETKSAIIRRYMAADDWRKAIAAAARLPQLGKHRTDILDAHGAYVRPEWARQMGKDADTLIAAGIAALREKFK